MSYACRSTVTLPSISLEEERSLFQWPRVRSPYNNVLNIWLTLAPFMERTLELIEYCSIGNAAYDKQALNDPRWCGQSQPRGSYRPGIDFASFQFRGRCGGYSALKQSPRYFASQERRPASFRNLLRPLTPGSAPSNRSRVGSCTLPFRADGKADRDDCILGHKRQTAYRGSYARS